ncbi:MAG: hypothetical protein ACTSU5_17700 [Promethearchaeota archaeon]
MTATMVETATLNRNYSLIESRMKEQTDISLQFGADLIEEHFKKNSGWLTGAFIKPAVKFFYNFIARKNLKKSAIEQLYITLDAARRIVEGDCKEGDERYREIVDETFPSYMKNDSTVLYCKKNHRNFPRLKEITYQTYLSQVKRVVTLLRIEGEVGTYNDLIKIAFPSKSEAREALSEQLDFTDEGIAMCEQDPSILDIPTAKNLILSVLRKGFEKTKSQFLEDLERMYPED